MRIGIDGSCWSNGRGFGRYTRELVTHLIQAGSQHEYVIIVDRHTATQHTFPPDAVLRVVDTRSQPTVAASAHGSRSLADLWRMAQAASKQRVDLFFYPAVYSYFPLLRRVPIVITFHDAIAEQHPDLIFNRRRARLFWNLKTGLALRQAHRLLTVSENAKRQIAESFRYAPSNIHVIHEGPGDEFCIIEDRERLRSARAACGLPVDVPLILYVGGMSPHKNLHGLLRALARLSAQSTLNWHAALVGEYSNDAFLGCHDELARSCREFGLNGRVTFTGFVPNDRLVALYNDAAMLVLPSFSEGFGLPVVEAMACGLPVAVSHCGSLPEVAGSAAMMFDPHNPDEIAGVLGRLLANSDLRGALRYQGLQRVKRFSWNLAARRTMELFEETVCAANASA